MNRAATTFVLIAFTITATAILLRVGISRATTDEAQAVRMMRDHPAECYQGLVKAAGRLDLILTKCEFAEPNTIKLLLYDMRDAAGLLPTHGDL